MTHHHIASHHIIITSHPITPHAHDLCEPVTALWGGDLEDLTREGVSYLTEQLPKLIDVSGTVHAQWYDWLYGHVCDRDNTCCEDHTHAVYPWERGETGPVHIHISITSINTTSTSLHHQHQHRVSISQSYPYPHPHGKNIFLPTVNGGFPTCQNPYVEKIKIFFIADSCVSDHVDSKFGVKKKKKKAPHLHWYLQPQPHQYCIHFDSHHQGQCTDRPKAWIIRARNMST